MFAIQKAPLRREKDKPETRRNYLKIMYLIRNLYLKYIKNSSFNNKTNQPIQMIRYLKRYSTKKDMHMANKHMKVCST